MTDRLLTASEVAEMLAVPVSWVREHTRSGAIPHVQLGRYVRYREAAVLKWLDSCSAESNNRPAFRRFTPSGGPQRATGI
jgi:excisionase family DNA binding protein